MRRCCALAICAPGNIDLRTRAEHTLRDDRVLIDSYHCSRYNTQTRRLTTAMFEAVIERARDLAQAGPPR